MTPAATNQSSPRGLLIVAVAISLASIGLRIGLATNSALGGAIAVLLVVALIAGISAIQQTRNGQRIDEMTTVAGSEINGGLELSGLPPDWQATARSAVVRFGAGNAPIMPVRIGVGGGRFIVDKRQGFPNGRRGLRIEIPFAAISGLTAGPPRRALLGSGLTLDLANGGRVHVDLIARRRVVEQFADTLGQWARAAADDAAERGFTPRAMIQERPPL